MTLLNSNGGAFIGLKYGNNYAGYEQYENSVKELTDIGTGSELQ